MIRVTSCRVEVMPYGGSYFTGEEREVRFSGYGATTSALSPTHRVELDTETTALPPPDGA
jgi:hypothetical protein